MLEIRILLRGAVWTLVPYKPLGCWESKPSSLAALRHTGNPEMSQLGWSYVVTFLELSLLG